jgi:hypothetical protein
MLAKKMFNVLFVVSQRHCVTNNLDVTNVLSYKGFFHVNKISIAYFVFITVYRVINISKISNIEL